jgi:hypothetical protein
MAEIDRRRALLDTARAEYRKSRAELAVLDAGVREALWMGEDDRFPEAQLAERWQSAASAEEVDEERVRLKEESVLGALRTWWAQDCKETALESWKDRIIEGLTGVEREALKKRFP